MSSLVSSLCASGRRSVLSASRINQALTGSLRIAAAAASAPANATTIKVSSRSLSRLGDSSLPSRSVSRAVPLSPSGMVPPLVRSLSAKPPSTLPLVSIQNNSNSRLQFHAWATSTTATTAATVCSKRGMTSKAKGGSAGRKGGDEGGSGAGKGGADEGGGEGGAEGAGKDGSGRESESEYDESDFEPQPEEGVGWLKGAAAACVLVLVLTAITATVQELIPSHMAPQSIMSRAHDVFQADPDTANHFGTPLKVYGRDNNRHREGRRNFVEHVDHEDPIDKSKRTRVRFNVEGPHGHGMAYAEVSNKMESGEWVYLCVQDMQTGHVITLHDNRAMLMAKGQAGSDEEKNAFLKMLGQ